MFLDFTKHYDNIRDILRMIFLYGCFSKNHIEIERGISSRKLNYELRRIGQYIDKDFFCEDRDGKTKLFSLTYDSISNTKNFLVDTYKSKSFTRADIVLYYGILAVINKSDEKITLSEIEEKLNEYEIINDDISSKTIERKVKELNEDVKIIDCIKEGNKKYYKMQEDILSDLDNDKIIKLYLVSSLFKNIIIPNSCGYFFTQTLEDYIKYERKIQNQYISNVDDYFQYRNLYFHPIIEEELVWNILNAIEDRKIVLLEYEAASNRRRRDKFKDEELKPYKIRYDLSCGRFYLVSFNKKGRCIVSRIDRIKKVKVTNKKYSEDFSEDYERVMKNSFSSVPANSESNMETLEFLVKISNDEDLYIKNKIKDELGICTIKKVNKGTYEVKKTVNDIYEMIPWIRSYSKYIQVISPKWVRKKMKSDVKEMLNIYGSIS